MICQNTRIMNGTAFCFMTILAENFTCPIDKVGGMAYNP